MDHVQTTLKLHDANRDKRPEEYAELAELADIAFVYIGRQLGINPKWLRRDTILQSSERHDEDPVFFSCSE